MDFVSIDFETANSSRDSACSIGVVTIEKGEIASTYYTLIKPPVLRFDSINVMIHGITKEDVKDAPTFDRVWNSLHPLLKDKIVIAHNASFDFSVLRKTLDTYNIPYPELEYHCSVIIAKKTWPDLPNHKLDCIARHLGISFHHHNAIEDAEAAAKLVIEAGSIHGAKTLPELNDKIGAKMGRLFPGSYTAASINNWPSYKKNR